MTRAERRTRQRTREIAAAGLVRHSIRETPAEMTENPNRGKHDPRVSNGSAARDLTASERIRAARADYRPLTIHSPILRARKSPHTTSYTI